ncbi:MAG: hypothetical protein Q8K70_10845 [Bacteroidota bacterium]|nr:hypothetical protein [Bacteroidota bacterium]
MKSNQIKTALFLSFSALLFTFNACKSDDPKPADQPINEGELITTLKVELTDSATGRVFNTAYFKDLDGEGGNPPTQFDTIKLNGNRTYFCKVTLLDESKTPSEDITEEVKEEAHEHLFVYESSNQKIKVSITDKDKNNLPLGIESKWQTMNNLDGKLKVILKHQSNGIKNGSALLGETDIEVDFNVIQMDK